MAASIFKRSKTSKPTQPQAAITAAVFPEDHLKLICSSSSTVQFTLWCKSLLFNSHGYTVYNSEGGMVFRVDNYAHDRRRESVLMDSAGNVLLTIQRCRRKILSVATISWEAFKGSSPLHKPALLKATKDVCNPSSMVNVASVNGADPQCYRMRWSGNGGGPLLHIYRPSSGSDSDSSVVAEVRRKHSGTHNDLLDKDVLALEMQPDFDQVIVMAMIMIADSMRRLIL